MDIKNSVLNYTRYKQLNWYGHVQRIDEERLTRKILKWCPPGRRRKGKPRNSWMQEVTTAMTEKELTIWNGFDRKEWRRKLKF